MNSKQTVSREEYRRLDNRVTCILQQRWPAKEISRWAGLLKGNQPPMWRKKCAASWIDVNVKAPPMAAPP